MKEVFVCGVSTNDIRAMIRVAGALLRGRPLRVPIEMQIRSLSITVCNLRDVLGRVALGDPEALEAARLIASEPE